MENAIGLIETKGIVAAISASDAMVKAANVKIHRVEKVGSAYVCVVIRGSVADVKSAIDLGAECAAKFGQVVSVNVIPRPSEEISRAFQLDRESEAA